MDNIRLIGLLLLTLGACKENDSAKSSSTGASASATSNNAKVTAQPKEAATKDVSLAPLPLKVVMPSAETAMTMDKSMGDHKSVGVSYDAIFAGINVSEPNDKSFAETKKSIKGDTVMFPFKKWVKEETNQVIVEFSSDGKSGYHAYAWKVIGGKPYLCQSSGLSGLKSIEDAEKVLKICDTLSS